MDLLAAQSVLIITAILCAGTRKSSILNTILVVTKVAIVLFVIIAGAVYADTSNWKTVLPFGVQGIFNGAAVVFFSFIGYGAIGSFFDYLHLFRFDNLCSMAEECKNPKKDLPVGIIGSLSISTVLYILTALVVTLLVPYNQM